MKFRIDHLIILIALMVLAILAFILSLLVVMMTEAYEKQYSVYLKNYEEYHNVTEEEAVIRWESRFESLSNKRHENFQLNIAGYLGAVGSGLEIIMCSMGFGIFIIFSWTLGMALAMIYGCGYCLSSALLFAAFGMSVSSELMGVGIPKPMITVIDPLNAERGHAEILLEANGTTQFDPGWNSKVYSFIIFILLNLCVLIGSLVYFVLKNMGQEDVGGTSVIQVIRSRSKNLFGEKSKSPHKIPKAESPVDVAPGRNKSKIPSSSDRSTRTEYKSLTSANESL